MKKLIAIIAASFMLVGALSGFAEAGHARRHTIEGIIIGTGAALLGTAIAHNMIRGESGAIRGGHRYGHGGRHRGHWETRKIWVEPAYEIRWNPGHYNRHGKWMCGRNQKFQIASGYWQKERTWVKHGPRY